jgi:hypothetical protein
LGNVGILLNRGVGSVGSPINESRIGSVSTGSKIIGGDVVSDSQHTVAVIVSNAGFFILRRKSPVERGLESINGVTQMIVSRPRRLNTHRRRNSPSRYFHPFVSSSKASWFVVFCCLSSIVGRISTEISRFDVLGFCLVEGTPGHIVGQNGNISPGGGSPIGIVISLLGAFESVSVSIVVLSGVDGSVSIQVALLLSISNKQSLVSLSGIAGIIIDSVLVHSISEKSSGISGSNSGFTVVNSISGGSVTNSIVRRVVSIGTHVLDDQIAIDFGVLSAAVLNGPFDGQ